jgi:hypothetical protein
MLRTEALVQGVVAMLLGGSQAVTTGTVDVLKKWKAANCPMTEFCEWVHGCCVPHCLHQEHGWHMLAARRARFSVHPLVHWTSTSISEAAAHELL